MYELFSKPLGARSTQLRTGPIFAALPARRACRAACTGPVRLIARQQHQPTPLTAVAATAAAAATGTAVHMQLSPILAAASTGSSLRLRPGQPSDRSTLWRMVLAEKLNPTGLDPARFTVAERTAADGSNRIVGVGQLKPLSDGAALELASLVVAPKER